MCVDVTDLNKAYLKDNFPLLKIKLFVDATTRHGALDFINAFLEYNQIMLHKID